MSGTFTRAARDYARYRRPMPAELYSRLAERFGIALAGQKVLDVGAGTGLEASELRRRGCDVVAADLDLELLRECRQEAAASQCIVARAEELPFGDGEFDGVTAAQCWHWFERRRAARELRRVLRPGGWLAVTYHMYLPLPGSIAERTESLILRHRPRWRHANSAGINGQVLRDVQHAGFERIESFTFDVVHEYTREEWRGLIRTTSVVAAMPETDARAFDEGHRRMLESEPQALHVPHRVFAAVAFRPDPAL